VESKVNIKKLYKYRVENLRYINESLNTLERLIRKAIATEDRDTHKALLPVYMLLLGAYAEARLFKVLFEPTKFTQTEITLILSAGNHKERWLKLIEVAFQKRKEIPITQRFIDTDLPRSEQHIYRDLKGLIEDELRIIIELRNKLAHGQWTYPFVSWEAPYLLDKLNISEENITRFRKENFLSLILKRGILDKLLSIVRDLGISQKAFPRDFDKYYNRIQNAKLQLKHRKYDRYKDSLIRKYKKGESIRNNLVPNKKSYFENILKFFKS
jgi:hypothetical protein